MGVSRVCVARQNQRVKNIRAAPRTGSPRTCNIAILEFPIADGDGAFTIRERAKPL